MYHVAKQIGQGIARFDIIGTHASEPQSRNASLGAPTAKCVVGVGYLQRGRVEI